MDLVAGPPHVEGMRTYRSGGDEHGILEGGAVGALAVGDTLLLQPSHCDPTVNLHDAFVFVGSGQDGAPALEAPVPIGARGPAQAAEDSATRRKKAEFLNARHMPVYWRA